MSRHLKFLTAMAVALAAGSLFLAAPGAHAATASHGHLRVHRAVKRYHAESLGDRALDWAESKAGLPYVWGGTGPDGYDCSGLVQAAFESVGVDLPRTTYEMLDSGHLHPVSSPVRGDLVFFGSGHVEIDTMWPFTTFGAHSTGQAIGWLDWGWTGSWPSDAMFFSVS